MITKGARLISTVDFMGWSGLTNGELFRTAEACGIEVFVTGDQNISYPQNLAGRGMSIVTLSAIDFDILKSNLSLIVAAIDDALAGSFVVVACGRFIKR